MDVEIINKPFRLDIHGFSEVVNNEDYTGTAFKLMDKMWQIVKVNELKNKGLNINASSQYVLWNSSYEIRNKRRTLAFA